MLLVKTKIQPSPTHGTGLFADEFIPNGTKIWEFTPGFDLKFTKEEIETFPNLLRKYLTTYTWLSKKTGKYCFSSDNGKYFNHSEQNNVLSTYVDESDEVYTFAIRDIQTGEELLDDYGSFEEGPIGFALE